MPLARSRTYEIHGLRISLVREPGVKLSERPALRTPSEAAPLFAQYIGESDREQFVIALLTIRHRVIGLNTVSVGCLTSSLVHPRLCCARHNVHYVAAVVMLRPSFTAMPVRRAPPGPPHNLPESHLLCQSDFRNASSPGSRCQERRGLSGIAH
jgi:hypothetical protein